MAAPVPYGVNIRHTYQIYGTLARQQILRHVTFGIRQRKLAHKGLHRRRFVLHARLDPLPARLVAPLLIIDRKFVQIASFAVAVDEHILLIRHCLGTRIVLLRDHLVDIGPLLVWKEVDQRECEVTVCSYTHRNDAEQHRKQYLQTLELKHGTAAIAIPHDEHHRQDYQILGECLPRRQLERIAETAAILHRYPRCAEERKHREEYHRCERENRYQTCTHLEQQHKAHHQLGTAQPYREDHTYAAQLLHAVYGEVFVDFQRRTPRIYRLHETREDEYQAHQSAAHMRGYLQLAAHLSTRSTYRFTRLRIRAKTSSGEAIASSAVLQSTT